ncbi:MAG: TRAP transporter fused permease subunit [Deltaproteobacteria bacterium]|nr:TRAP transporter fused permease subunit [Deltaproteobacteria bacterium]
MGKPVESEAETTRYGSMPGYLKVFFLILTTFGLCLSIFYIFIIRIGDVALYEVAYYYCFIGIFLGCAFLLLPARKKDKGIPWYDLLATILAFGLGGYFFLNAWEIGMVGSWRPLNPFHFTLGLIYCLLMLEAARRMAGPFFLVLCLIGGLYPLIAGHMPGMLYGLEYSLSEVVGLNIFSIDGILGLPGRVMAGIVVGFLLFAAVLMATGAGQFFLDLSLALFGRYRGGPAKVAVLASGFFGSLSGSSFSNIAATGAVTIPIMKRLGYPPHYAAAVEACASSGGMLMPPVMGSVIFIMCAFLGVDYGVIVVVAAIPSVLFYFGLLMQIDAYAAKVGIKGLPREQLPSLRKTLNKGWPFVIVFAFLVWGLAYMKWSIQTPFYATGLMVLLSFRSRETMMTPKIIINCIAETGKLVAQVMAVVLPMSFILVGLGATGVDVAFTSSLLALGGENVFLILIVGVIACFLLGMVGMIGAAYILLAVSMAPAVIQIAGLNELAVHFFIMYYACLALITPPVATSAFMAAAIAGASPMRTAFQSMRLGIVLYFIPFFFVFNPSLILQGSVIEAVYLFVLCLLGILFIAAGLEGYLVKVGRLRLWVRPLIIIAGTLIAFPEWKTTFIGAVLAALIVAVAVRQKEKDGMQISDITFPKPSANSHK